MADEKVKQAIEELYQVAKLSLYKMAEAQSLCIFEDAQADYDEAKAEIEKLQGDLNDSI